MDPNESTPISTPREAPPVSADVHELLQQVSRDLFAAPRGTSSASQIPDDVLASMLSALELTGQERVLELGSATGYETALLSRLAAEVVSVHTTTDEAEWRTSKLAELGCHNVRSVVLDESGRLPAGQPFQGMLVLGGMRRLPQSLVDHLDQEGRLVIPLGDASGQVLELIRHHGIDIASQALGPCHLTMLELPILRTESAQRESEHKLSPFPWTNREPSSH
jgi:protein-L-isoaspartate(D-aspartate) O-methyltransferase